jgi:thiamine-monophosphate kinase
MTTSGDEFALIDWIRSRTADSPNPARCPVGIGDDAAVWRPSSANPDTLVTVDMLMDGVDFRIEEADPERIGRKALAVNLSDIAAMGGVPTAAVVSVALPQDRGLELGRRLHAGIQTLADEFRVAIIGGDTNSWPNPLVISITVLGDVASKGPVLRSGAMPGDWILATGEFGGSILGKHFDFTPRVREATALQAACRLHAMIDVSDGLAVDLGRIVDASGVGATLDALAIPLSAAAEELSKSDQRPALDHALGDGEDFELVFTLSQQDAQRLLEQPPFETRLTKIGEITAEPGFRLRQSSGDIVPLPRLGWQHRLS